MDQVQAFLLKIGEVFGPQIMMVFALIAAQLISGIAVALKLGVFEWKKIGDFYRTVVLPMLLGWLTAAILAHFVIVDYLPADLKVLGPGIEIVAFGAVVLSLGGAVLQNLQAIGLFGTGAVSKALSAAGIPTPVQAAKNEAVITKLGGGVK